MAQSGGLLLELQIAAEQMALHRWNRVRKEPDYDKRGHTTQQPPRRSQTMALFRQLDRKKVFNDIGCITDMYINDYMIIYL